MLGRTLTQRQRCDRGDHLPLINRAKYQAAGPFWEDYGDCPCCRNTLRITAEQKEQEAANRAANAG